MFCACTNYGILARYDAFVMMRWVTGFNHKDSVVMHAILYWQYRASDIASDLFYCCLSLLQHLNCTYGKHETRSVFFPISWRSVMTFWMTCTRSFKSQTWQVSANHWLRVSLFPQFSSYMTCMFTHHLPLSQWPAPQGTLLLCTCFTWLEQL